MNTLVNNGAQLVHYSPTLQTTSSNDRPMLLQCRFFVHFISLTNIDISAYALRCHLQPLQLSHTYCIVPLLSVTLFNCFVKFLFDLVHRPLRPASVSSMSCDVRYCTKPEFWVPRRARENAAAGPKNSVGYKSSFPFPPSPPFPFLPSPLELGTPNCG